MNIPGVNLLNIALGVIRPQMPTWGKYLSSTVNAAGFDVPTYAAPVAIRASVQDVDEKQAQDRGLDMLKTYINVYTSQAVATVDRDTNGDLIYWGGNTYSCESSADWELQDGWNAILCVKVPA